MKFIKVRSVTTPSRAEDSAGIDFYVPDKMSLPDEYHSMDKITVKPGASVLIPSGIKVFIEKGNALVAFNKSGVSVKKGFICGACVVDASYSGEVHLHLINVSNKEQEIHFGEKILQFVYMPFIEKVIEQIEENEFNTLHENSKRGNGGFGSTGNGLQ